MAGECIAELNTDTNWFEDKSTVSNEGDICFDNSTNTIQINSGNGEILTLDSGNGLTYSGLTTLTTNTSSGDYLIYNGNDMAWTTSGYMGTENFSNDFIIFNNKEIEIDAEGNVLIGGKKEFNPSKIGLALLRAITVKKEAKQTISSMDDICDE